MRRQKQAINADKKQKLLPDYGRKRLLTYADSFRELAEVFEEMPQKEQEGEWDRQEVLWKKKLRDNCGLMAGQLQEFANIMEEVAEESFCYEALGERKTKAIIQGLMAEGIQVQELYRIQDKEGAYEYLMLARKTGKREKNVQEAADILSVILNCRLTPADGSPLLLADVYKTFRFVEEAKFHVLTGVALAVKENEEVSGDNYSIYQTDRGKLTMLLSDGMGSGKKANEDSRIVIELAEKLLEAGFRPEMAVQMLNSSILAGSEEQNMSSLDLCQIDLRTGAGDLIKIGGANTYIKRAHLVEQISARNLPLGIFMEIETEPVTRQLMDGDYIFMISDGISDGFAEGNGEAALLEVISHMSLENPKEMANCVLNHAMKESKGRIRDDMTVMVVGLWENVF